MTEDQKMAVLLRAIERGIPPERAYRLVILRRERISGERSREGASLGQPRGIPSEHREP